VQDRVSLSSQRGFCFFFGIFYNKLFTASHCALNYLYLHYLLSINLKFLTDYGISFGLMLNGHFTQEKYNSSVHWRSARSAVCLFVCLLMLTK